MGAKRAQILDAAAREMMEHGYAGSSLSAIAAHLGLTKGALVREFPTKEDLAWSIIETLQDAIDLLRREAFERFPESGLRGLLDFLVSLRLRTVEEPRFAAGIVLLTDPASPTRGLPRTTAGWLSAIVAFLRRGQEVGELPEQLDLEAAAEFLLMLCAGRGAVVVGERGLADAGKLQIWDYALAGISAHGIEAAIADVAAVPRS